MHRGSMPYQRFFGLGFEKPVLPAHCVCWPSRHVLIVQQKHVEVIGIRELSQFVNLLLRIHAFPRRYLRHQPVTIAWNALQCHTQHLVHFAVRLGCLEEADSPIVGMAYEPRELLLSKLALDSSTK